MKRRQLAFHVAVTAALLIGMGVWMHFHVQAVAQDAVAKYERKNLEQWKEVLLPAWRASDVRHSEDPQTTAELFQPMFTLLQPLGEPKNDGPDGGIPSAPARKSATR